MGSPSVTHTQAAAHFWTGSPSKEVRQDKGNPKTALFAFNFQLSTISVLELDRSIRQLPDLFPNHLIELLGATSDGDAIAVTQLV